MRPAQPLRGQYRTWDIVLLRPGPKSRPTHSPVPGSGPSKKVLRLPSMAFSFVLPLLFQEPAVPMIVPVSSLSARRGGAEERRMSVSRKTVIPNSKIENRNSKQFRNLKFEIRGLKLGRDIGNKMAIERGQAEHISVFG